MFNIGNLSELKIESKIGNLNCSSEEVYSFLSDFNNLTSLIPADKVKDWKATTERCTFSIENAGEMGLEIIEKEPTKLIKITGIESVPYKFFLWIQLKEIADSETKIKLTIKAKLNPIVKSAANKPLQTFVDSLVDQLGVLFA